MANHYATAFYFLMKLYQAMVYMGVNPEAGFKKKIHFQGWQSYDKNRSYVRSLMDTGFITFTGVDKDTFIDVVNGDQYVFTPDIFNSTDYDVDQVSEE